MTTNAPRNFPARTFIGRVLLLVAAGASLTLAACNTTAGAGRDIKAAGQGIENVAEDAKD